MATHSPLSTDEDAQPCDWEDPLMRLMLLLEIASEPAWLRDLAEQSAGTARAAGATGPAGATAGGAEE
ncbi:hypothetical protein DVA86_19900 [Streptomyces armeniacus]|uniref:Uncharacterized protein n=1 Tax=Streptomyces armeniacus TaxID=83291 RepID=A0A345XSF7_9ACTN|nr:hypothetical protein [Streptomyces armeniacus]AXK34573.1 hypothetical protein DVA86_19900 [Streptomyces armeniacus]